MSALMDDDEETPLLLPGYNATVPVPGISQMHFKFMEDQIGAMSKKILHLQQEMKTNPSGSLVLIALQFTHTVLPRTLTTYAFWVFLTIHLMCFTLHSAGFLSAEAAKLNRNDLRVIVTITVFFEVWYTRQCYQRFERLWSLTNISFTYAYDIAFSMRLFVERSGRPYDRVALRWVIVSMVLSFVEARKKHTATRKDVELMVDLGLVRTSEVPFLTQISGQQRMLIMLHAAASVVRIGGDLAGAPPDAPKNFCLSLMAFRSAQQEMHDLLKFPLPFGYVHLLSLMVCLCLGAEAYGMAISGSNFAPFFYSLTSVVFIGMMDLASRLSDPLGEDDSDFPLSSWLQKFLYNVACLIDYEHDGSLDDFAQEIEEEERAPTEFMLAPRQVEDVLGYPSADEIGGGKYCCC